MESPFFPRTSHATAIFRNRPHAEPVRAGKERGQAEQLTVIHRFLPRFWQNVTLLTDPIDNCFAIHRLLTVVSRRNRRMEKVNGIDIFPVAAQQDAAWLANHDRNIRGPFMDALLQTRPSVLVGVDPKARHPGDSSARDGSDGKWLPPNDAVSD